MHVNLVARIWMGTRINKFSLLAETGNLTHDFFWTQL